HRRHDRSGALPPRDRADRSRGRCPVVRGGAARRRPRERVPLPRRPRGARNAPMNQFVVLYRLFLRSIATTGRIAALGALGALGIIVGAALDADTARQGAQFVNNFGLTVTVPLTTLVFASAALGDIIDDGTMVYLWL